MENDIVKVYGYYRSGNNFLIQSLIKNFQFPDLSLQINSQPEWNRFQSTFKFDSLVSNSYQPKLLTKEIWIHPYGKLVAGHHKANYDNKGIYIIRNPRDVMLSLWRLRGFSQDFAIWCDNYQLEKWKDHITHYLDKGFFYLKYEDLRDNFSIKMEEIHKHFNLTPINDSYSKLDKLVGWGPKRDKLEGITRKEKDFSIFLNEKFKPFVQFYNEIK